MVIVCSASVACGIVPAFHWMSDLRYPAGGRIFVLPAFADWLSRLCGLEKKDASMNEMALNSFAILEINLEL